MHANHKIPSLFIPPLHTAAGTVRLPGSKSISNRALLLSALAQGTTRLHGLLASDDTAVMLAALQQLGVKVTQTDGVCSIQSPGASQWRSHAELFLGNAGTAMRPLVAALALVAASKPDVDYRLSGTARMHERPIADLVDALVAGGCAIRYVGQTGYPPLHISAAAQHRLAQTWTVRGDVSSQFLTALLMAAPLLAAQQTITIQVDGPLISKPYIDITVKLMAAFGVAVAVDARDAQALRYSIAAGSQYCAVADYWVEPDASSASYFLALGAIAADDGIVLEGLGQDSMQGDIAFAEYVQAMGAEVQMQAQRICVRRKAWPLQAIDADCNAIPDAAMTLAVMALYADGPCTLRNIASWRVKETDRLSAMHAELARCGARVEEGADTITVYPLAAADWRAARIRTYDDHRMAMCFALTAFNPARIAMQIEDPACVAKTFPDFFKVLWSVAHTPAESIPVITIDGPSASGKGTLASSLAQALGFHYLDSGALYRAVAWAALEAQVDVQDAPALLALIETVQPHSTEAGVTLTWQGQVRTLTDALRSEAVGTAASKLAALPTVRQSLLALQRHQRQLPGLVCDGRDMGTVVFPDAALKIHLTASAHARAQRRLSQLQDQPQLASAAAPEYASILADLEARDARDKNRSSAPLQAASDAIELDNSDMDKQESLAGVLQHWHAKTLLP